MNLLPSRRAWFAALLPLTLIGCHQPAAAVTPGEAAAAAAVKVAVAAQRPWPRAVRVQGSLVADEEAVIGSKVAGRVLTVKVDRGTVVAQGQVLAELEPEEFGLHVQQAEAQLAQVRAKLGLKPGQPEEQLDRTKAPPVVQERALLEEARLLVERARLLTRQNGAVTLEELQKEEAALRVAEARYASALNQVDEQIALLGVRRAELSLAKQQQADAKVTAPFPGLIQERHVAPGVYLKVGEPVAVLVRTDPLRFHAGVPEREAAQVKVGEPLRIFVEGATEPIAAAICRISPALDMASRSLVIEADVPNPQGRWRAGLFAEAEIVVEAEAQALTVPDTAVTEFAGVEKAYLVKGGQAIERRVFTGRRRPGLVEILGGVSTGDRVVADATTARPGPVRVE